MHNKLILIVVPFIILFFTACTQKQVGNIEIADLKKYSQNPSEYTKNLDINLPNQKEHVDDYIKNYFLPWDISELTYSKKEASWGNSYSKKKIYLENHNVASKEWFKKQISNSNFENYNQTLQKAITVKNTSLRVFPTSNNMFYNPKKAGEGFPFDYNQNTAIKINTPLLISHYSKDRAWAFIQSHVALGWIRVDNITLVDEEFINAFKTNDYAISKKEYFPIFDTQFLEYIKVGTLFPTKNGKYLLASKNGIKEINLNIDEVAALPLKLDKNNLGLIANEFIGEMYGWGGLNNLRDCSSFTQDFFAPFGIYLKRNSRTQTEQHKYINLSKMKDNEKKEYIKKNAIPFLTLVYLRGHIMLYVGIKNNEPMVMHNMWGVRTKDSSNNSGRNVVGKTVITTLEPGIELSNTDKKGTLLKGVRGIVLLNERVEKGK